mgnify:FL=1
MKMFLSMLALVVLSSAANAQVGSLVDADVNERLSIEDPAVAAAKTGDGWFAFSFPAIEGTRSPCCWKGTWKRTTEVACALEKEFQSYGTSSSSPEEDTIVAYAKVDRGEVARLKVAGAQCPMDAGGKPVTWIGGTDRKDTLDWLEDLARTGNEDRIGHSALWAMALHAGDSATDRLHALAREKNGELAGESIFWLGEARGEAGFEALEELLQELPAGDTRRQINFALGQNDSDEAVSLLADIARSDRDPEQRGDALFWLAQEYPEQAEPLIRDIIETDRDSDLLERAVFALSQLPEDIAGPALMAVLKDSDAPREARRHALFWLVHEGDEESVTALTELLTR